MQHRPSRTRKDVFEQARGDVLRYHSFRRLAAPNPSIRARILRATLFVAVLLCCALVLKHVHISRHALDAFCFIEMAVFGMFLFARAGRGSSRFHLRSMHVARQRYENALDFLVGAHDPRAIGPLMEIYWLRPAPTGVAGALTRLLRVYVQNADLARLDVRQRQRLCRLLTLRHDSEALLQIAALDYLAVSGDKNALPAVAKLADDPTRPPALQAAAQQCLLALQSQAIEASLRQTLLRPPCASPAELLRPVSASSQEDVSLLLRASTDR